MSSGKINKTPIKKIEMSSFKSDGPNKSNNNVVIEEVVINEVPMSARNHLTKTSTQEEINMVCMFEIYVGIVMIVANFLYKNS